MGCGGSTEKTSTATKPSGDKKPNAGQEYRAGDGQSANYKKFRGAFAPLTLMTPESKEKRIAAWKKADPNGNGHCSLAELDAWIKAHLLDCGCGEELWKQFRPSYIRAFADARDVGANKPLGSGNASTDDFVQKATFRLFLAYLVVYGEMYDAFDLCDGGGRGGQDNDRKIDLNELKKGITKLPGYSFACFQGLDASKAEKLFKEMDADGKGAIMLVEWCRWIEQSEQKAGTETGKLLAIGDDEKN